MSSVTTLVQRVEKSDSFAAFRDEAKEAYLAHLFLMHAPGEEVPFQLGYYDPATKKLTVFQERQGVVERLPEDDAFTKGKIAPLDLSRVTVEWRAAEERALAAHREKSPAERVTKVIIVLQHLDRQLYNITLVTDHFNIVNVRIDAHDGEMVKYDARSIMSLKASDA